MRTLDRLLRKIKRLRCRYISNKFDSRHVFKKGVITIYHDYESHYHSEDVMEYSDRGIHEILRIEKKYGIRASYNIVAKLLDDVPIMINQIWKNQHEIACHSLAHEILSRLAPDDLRRNMESAIQIFRKNGFRLYGLRSPQSRWSFRQLPIMLNLNFRWSAENDDADFPYPILRNKYSQLIRMPIKMDDWDYEGKETSPNEMFNQLVSCAENIAEGRIYGAIGFHPWVQGKNGERLRVFEEFMGYVVKNPGLRTMTFKQACDKIMGSFWG